MTTLRERYDKALDLQGAESAAMMMARIAADALDQIDEAADLLEGSLGGYIAEQTRHGQEIRQWLTKVRP